MSVPTWKRNVSKVEYIRELYSLNKSLGEITTKLPKKYSKTYSDKVINLALEALINAEEGNDIFINDYESYMERKRLLKRAIRDINALGSVSYIYLELVKKADGKYSGKIPQWEEDIGKKCNYIANMVRKVLKSDADKYRSIERN